MVFVDTGLLYSSILTDPVDRHSGQCNMPTSASQTNKLNWSNTSFSFAFIIAPLLSFHTVVHFWIYTIVRTENDIDKNIYLSVECPIIHK